MTNSEILDPKIGIYLVLWLLKYFKYHRNINSQNVCMRSDSYVRNPTILYVQLIIFISVGRVYSVL